VKGADSGQENPKQPCLGEPARMNEPALSKDRINAGKRGKRTENPSSSRVTTDETVEPSPDG